MQMTKQIENSGSVTVGGSKWAVTYVHGVDVDAAHVCQLHRQHPNGDSDQQPAVIGYGDTKSDAMTDAVGRLKAGLESGEIN